MIFMFKGCFYEASNCRVIMPIMHECDKVTWKQEYYDKEVWGKYTFYIRMKMISNIISISEWKSFQIQNMQVSYIAISFACNTSPQQRRIVCPPRTFAFSVFSIDIYYWCLQTSGTKKGFHYPLVYIQICSYITHCIFLMYKRFGRCTCHQLSVFWRC